jgi:hypothetical protein
VELGPQKVRYYTEANEKHTVTLHTTKFNNYNISPKFFVLYSKTIKGKHFVLEMEVPQGVTEKIYIHIYVYRYICTFTYVS